MLGSYLNGKHMGGVYHSPNLAMYSYTHQNPVKFTDPDGNSPDPFDLFLGAYDTGGLLASGVMYAVGSMTGNEGLKDVALESIKSSAIDVASDVAIPGGSKTLHALEKTAGEAKSVAGAMQRGRETETKMLDKLGHEKNTGKVKGSEGDSIPDYMTKDPSGKVTGTGEIKDVKKQSLSKQLRIQTEAAREGGYAHNLHVRPDTKVSGPAEAAVRRTGGEVFKDVTP